MTVPKALSPLRPSLAGCLLGTAVGDALGLPYEGLSPGRARRLLGPPDRYRLFFGRGMVSDDTDHACLTAEALLASRLDPDAFARHLARSLRWWLASLPAGVGFATLRSILRLWLGVSPARSGVFSAGNGPCMRAPILGVALADDPARLKEFVRRSTVITHRDPRAFHAALSQALAAAMSRETPLSGEAYLARLAHLLDGEAAEETLACLARACRSAQAGEPLAVFAEALGCRRGITGYALHTAPCVIQVWLRHADDFSGGIQEIIEAGGDADTTAAILGGILGARVGAQGLPPAWLDGLLEWPRTIAHIAQLGDALGRRLRGEDAVVVPAFSRWGIPLRNLAFLAIVLTHGFRRLAPPYG